MRGRLAEQATQAEQPNVGVSYKEKATITRNLLKPRSEKDVRQWSGHNRFNAHNVQKVQADAVTNLSLLGRRPNSRSHTSTPKMRKVQPGEKSNGDLDDLRKTT